MQVFRQRQHHVPHVRVFRLNIHLQVIPKQPAGAYRTHRGNGDRYRS